MQAHAGACMRALGNVVDSLEAGTGLQVLIMRILEAAERGQVGAHQLLVGRVALGLVRIEGVSRPAPKE